MVECLDAFCHCLPPAYVAVANRTLRTPLHMFRRAQQIPVMVDVDARLALMDQFPGYSQILSLASPPPEVVAGPRDAPDLARIANDAMAELVSRHPARFPAFVATLPLNNERAALDEAERAITKLGAVGVQVFTSVNGKPLDCPQLLSVFERMADLRRGVWLHPTRAIDTPDYPHESLSRFDLWWAFGWPHETSVAMGRLVFAGVFDRWPDLVIVTHHVGGTVPMLAGRIDAGLDQLGTRNTPDQAAAVESRLQHRPIDSFRKFHADTASFGCRQAIEIGAKFFGIDRLMFASDMPFGPEDGVANIRTTLKAIDQLSLTADERQCVLSGNVRRICRLDPASDAR